MYCIFILTITHSGKSDKVSIVVEGRCVVFAVASVVNKVVVVFTKLLEVVGLHSVKNVSVVKTRIKTVNLR